MSDQSVDKFGAADFLGLTMPTVNRRIAAGTFPDPDHYGSGNSDATDWWTLKTLEKYQRAQARKPRKRKK